MGRYMDPTMQAIIDNAFGKSAVEPDRRQPSLRTTSSEAHLPQSSPHFTRISTRGGENLVQGQILHDQQPFPSIGQQLSRYYEPRQDIHSFQGIGLPRRTMDGFQNFASQTLGPSTILQLTPERVSLPLKNDHTSSFGFRSGPEELQSHRRHFEYEPLMAAQDMRNSFQSRQGYQQSLSISGEAKRLSLSSFREQPIPHFNVDQFAYQAPIVPIHVRRGAVLDMHSSSPCENSSPTERLSTRRPLDKPLWSSRFGGSMDLSARTGVDDGTEHETMQYGPLVADTNSQSMSPSIGMVTVNSAFLVPDRTHSSGVLAETFSNPISTRETTTPSLPQPPIISTPVVQGIRLVSPLDLPDRFRHIFPYPLFNAVQSKCFDLIYQSTDNVVISAPTGSGKTCLLELAICKLVENHDFTAKIVYQAPTKSLCAERVRDWTKKFSHLNLHCAELTGDKDSADMRAVGKAAIIVTTPEKWDSITRKWKDHIKLLQMVKLFLIDEVHILRESRGATLEAVVSRMKSIGVEVRFIALSATVPNSHDIASWLGRTSKDRHSPARLETFGESFRPVVLQKFVYGYENKCNDYAYDSILDAKLPNLIAKHTKRKPTLIFCFTRKSCETTAASLAAWWAQTDQGSRPWPQPSRRIDVASNELRPLISKGVSFHHAGLDPGDRAAVENGFLHGDISIICCTSTLAIGVNLPCHLVVIKGTVGHQDGGLNEYSDLELMQMLGRAGRPQFDTEATAIIVTRGNKVERYKKMISGQDIVESTLHLNLIEHLNSEIGLETVHDPHSTKDWLAGTFLSVRMRENPKYYKFDGDTDSMNAEERLERVAERNIKLLQSSQLVTTGPIYRCTDYGLAMSKFMVSYESMKTLLSVPKQAKLGQILLIVSQASEFKDIRMKANERNAFRQLNKLSLIKFPIKENISTSAHKVSLIVQVELGGVELPTDVGSSLVRKQFVTEKCIVFEKMQRLLMCLVECKTSACDAIGACNALELCRSIAASAWENSSLQMRQIDGIGPVAVKKFYQSGIKTIEDLRFKGSADIERILSRNPPFGNKIVGHLEMFPRLALKAEISRKILIPESPVKVQVKAHLSASKSHSTWNGRPISVTFLAFISSGELVHVWRGVLQKLHKDLCLTFLCSLAGPSDFITCQLACDSIVGTLQSVDLHPGIPASAFPSWPILAQTSSEDDAEFEWDDEGIDQAIEAVAAAESVLLAAKLPVSRAAIIPRDDTDDQSSSRLFELNEDFIDVEIFDDAAETRDEKFAPVQRPDGRWECNHSCNNGTTKKGIQCAHKCCRDGLDKPRKPPIPKLKSQFPSEDSSGQSKTSKDKVSRSQMKLKDPNCPSYVGDVELLNLSEEPSAFSYADIGPRQYHKLFDLHTKIQDAGSACLPKNTPLFSYSSNTQPDLSFLGLAQDIEGAEDDDGFPSPSDLMGAVKDDENTSNHDIVATLGFPTHAELKDTEEAADISSEDHYESFTDQLFDFDTYEARTCSPSAEASVAGYLAAPKKRKLLCSPYLSTDSSLAKRFKHRDLVAETLYGPEAVKRKQELFEMRRQEPLPEWAKEIEPHVIDFLRGWVEFAPDS